MTSRREVLALTAAAALAPLEELLGQAAERTMPLRPIPATGELLPVVGLGSSKVVAEIAANGTEPVAAVLRALLANGGRVIDTWPRDPGNDAGLGRVLAEPDLEPLFVTSKIDRVGRQAGIEQFRETQRLYGRRPLDLLQVFSLTDVDTHWPTLRMLKDAGDTRYIGVTVAEARLYGALEEFLGRETPDFVQLNYSITERDAEARLLPMLADRGIAVLINRPFMNGAYFERLEGQALPAWAAEFECTTWAQFSLKYILANPSFTCVLTETSNPRHMAENAQTAMGPLPDEAARARMRAFIAQVS